jgi:hypothetical protein
LSSRWELQCFLHLGMVANQRPLQESTSLLNHPPVQDSDILVSLFMAIQLHGMIRAGCRTQPVEAHMFIQCSYVHCG